MASKGGNCIHPKHKITKNRLNRFRIIFATNPPPPPINPKNVCYDIWYKNAVVLYPKNLDESVLCIFNSTIIVDKYSHNILSTFKDVISFCKYTKWPSDVWISLYICIYVRFSPLKVRINFYFERKRLQNNLCSFQTNTEYLFSILSDPTFYNLFLTFPMFLFLQGVASLLCKGSSFNNRFFFFFFFQRKDLRELRITE